MSSERGFVDRATCGKVETFDGVVDRYACVGYAKHEKNKKKLCKRLARLV